MKSPAFPAPAPILEELVTFVQAHSPGACLESLRYEVELQLWISNLCHLEQFSSQRYETLPPAQVTPAKRSDAQSLQVAGQTSSSGRRSSRRMTKQYSSDADWLMRPWAMA